MAAFYASSPPPQKAPSIAPTQNSELTSPSEDNSATKKKSSNFMKRALKELAGGGGNNPKVKGQPVVRPYGRGGVGAKPKPSASSAKTSSSTSPPQSVSSPSNPPKSPTTDNSIGQQQRHLQVPNQQPLQPARDDTPSQSTYEYSSDYDDNQSLASSIPAPRRTQQWIQQQVPLSGSQSSMSPTSSHDPYTNQPYAYSHSSRLHDVEENDDPATHMHDQFGRLSVVNSSVPDHHSSASRTDPRTRLVLHPSSSVSANSRPGPSTAARDIAANYMAQYASNGGPSSSVSASRPTAESYASTSYNSYHSHHHPQSNPYHHHQPHHHPHPQSVVDHYSAAHAQNQAVHAQSHFISSQTQELQSQIESLREAERRARERLEALRRDDDVPGRQDVDPISPMALSAPPRNATSPIPQGMRSGMGGSQLEGPSSIPGIRSPAPGGSAFGITSREDRARDEKERLRQRDREREEAAAAAAYHHHDPYASQSLSNGQQQQHRGYHQEASTYSQSAYPSHMHSHVAHNPPHSVASTSAPPQHFMQPPQPAPQAPQQAYTDPAQQQLILQLGALLIQQQHQLAALNASRPGGSGASPPTGGQSLPSPAAGGLDLGALLAFAAAAGNLNLNPAAAAAVASTSTPRAAPGPNPQLMNPNSSPSSRPNPGSPTHPPQMPIPPIPITTTTSTTVSVPTSQTGRQTPPSQSTTPIIKRKVSSGTPITNTFNRDAGNPPQLPQPEFGREFSLGAGGRNSVVVNGQSNLGVPSNSGVGGGSPASASSSLNTSGSNMTTTSSSSAMGNARSNVTLSNSAFTTPRRPPPPPNMNMGLNAAMMTTTTASANSSDASNSAVGGLGVAHLGRDLDNMGMGLQNEDMGVGSGSEVSVISPPPPYVRAAGGI